MIPERCPISWLMSLGCRSPLRPLPTTLTPFFCTYWAFILVSLAKAVRFGEGAMIIIPFPLLCARESLCGAKTAALQSTLSVLACLPI